MHQCSELCIFRNEYFHTENDFHIEIRFIIRPNKSLKNLLTPLNNLFPHHRYTQGLLSRACEWAVLQKDALQHNLFPIAHATTLASGGDGLDVVSVCV